ncbi:MAG: TetR/AcrR family transcriptional regulator [Myxococcota bacterium]
MARPRLISDEQILATMRACVLEHGPQVSLDVVAGRLNVTPPALLKRFGTRRELMVKALRPPENPAVFARMAVAPDGRPLPVQLEEVLGGLWDFLAEAMPCIFALRESGIPHDEIFDPRRDSPARFIKALKGWLERAAAAGLVENQALDTAAVALLGAVQTRVFTAHVMKQPLTPRARREYLDDLTQFFTRALAPSGRRTRSAAS